MAQKTRTKFNVAEITKFGNAGGGRIVLFPVMVGDNTENKKVWMATPSGKIELWIDNPKTMDAFDFGEYYVDLIRVDE